MFRDPTIFSASRSSDRLFLYLFNEPFNALVRDHPPVYLTIEA
jgi:hypothetical protein